MNPLFQLLLSVRLFPDHHYYEHYVVRFFIGMNIMPPSAFNFCTLMFLGHSIEMNVVWNFEAGETLKPLNAGSEVLNEYICLRCAQI
jgi:hypothetical protein